MKPIHFPTDFEITESYHNDGSLVYIHQRKDGSIISVIQYEDNDLYDIWDEKHMDFCESMDFNQITKYLNFSVSKLLSYEFLLKEDLTLN